MLLDDKVSFDYIKSILIELISENEGDLSITKTKYTTLLFNNTK